MKILTKPAPRFIAIGALKFTPNASALVDTLFCADGTASGIYSVRKRGVLFSRANGEPFAFLVANPGSSQFFVSCFKQPDGRLRYMNGTTDEAERLLGLAGMTYSQKSDEATRVWSEVRP